MIFYSTFAVATVLSNVPPISSVVSAIYEREEKKNNNTNCRLRRGIFG